MSHMLMSHVTHLSGMISCRYTHTHVIYKSRLPQTWRQENHVTHEGVMAHRGMHPQNTLVRRCFQYWLPKWYKSLFRYHFGQVSKRGTIFTFLCVELTVTLYVAIIHYAMSMIHFEITYSEINKEPDHCALQLVRLRVEKFETNVTFRREEEGWKKQVRTGQNRQQQCCVQNKFSMFNAEALLIVVMDLKTRTQSLFM